MIKQYRLLVISYAGYNVWLTGPDKFIMLKIYSKKTIQMNLIQKIKSVMNFMQYQKEIINGIMIIINR